MNILKKILCFFSFGCTQSKSTTVRYAFPMIFTFVALLGASAIVSNNKSFIRLESSVNSVRAGETFFIDVFVTAHVPVNAVDITLEFPKNQIQVTGIDKGESVITLWTKEPKVEGNKVVLSGGTFRRGFIGDHKIATVNAKAIETGLAKFSVDDVLLLAGDGSGSKVTVSKTEKDSATLYITKEDGTREVSSDTDAIAVKGSTSVVIITDIDGDGQVTLGDVSRFMGAWRSRSVVYDFNGDGHMTFRDFGIILADSFLR
jgi:hypothetical protein